MDTSKICYIAGGGADYGFSFIPAPEDLVIAADAGFRYLERQKIAADYIIGDFDSLSYIPQIPNLPLSPWASEKITTFFICMAEPVGA